ncbi:hypothetical protein Tco_0829174 [Tanacetum coccineum]
MPIFHMSIFKVPSSVLQRLESIRSRFFKGHDLGSNKASWVKWSNVLTSKEKGGLGVSSLYALNRGLLFKWVWKFYAQKTSLWARVIKAIHGVDGKMGKAINSGASSCWTSIVREVEVFEQQGVNFFVRLDSSFRQKARGGIEQVQYEELSDMVNSISLTPKNTVRGGVEQTQFDAVILAADTINLVPQYDRYKWTLSNAGEYSVASFRKKVDCCRSSSDATRTRWVNFIPIKILNLSRALHVKAVLKPRLTCFSVVDWRTRFYVEDARWWNVSYAGFSSYTNWFEWMMDIRLPSKLKELLEGVFYTTWWFLWGFRNKILFDSTYPSKAILFDNILSSSFMWCNSRCKASFKWNDWLKNSYLIAL